VAVAAAEVAAGAAIPPTVTRSPTGRRRRARLRRPRRMISATRPWRLSPPPRRCPARRVPRWSPKANRANSRAYRHTRSRKTPQCAASSVEVSVVMVLRSHNPRPLPPRKHNRSSSRSEVSTSGRNDLSRPMRRHRRLPVTPRRRKTKQQRSDPAVADLVAASVKATQTRPWSRRRLLRTANHRTIPPSRCNAKPPPAPRRAAMPAAAEAVCPKQAWTSPTATDSPGRIALPLAVTPMRTVRQPLDAAMMIRWTYPRCSSLPQRKRASTSSSSRLHITSASRSRPTA
jgi:hypothetical protein